MTANAGNDVKIVHCLADLWSRAPLVHVEVERCAKPVRHRPGHCACDGCVESISGPGINRAEMASTYCARPALGYVGAGEDDAHHIGIAASSNEGAVIAHCAIRRDKGIALQCDGFLCSWVRDADRFDRY